MDDATLGTYAFVFLSVFAPYLAASLWVGTPPAARDAARLSLPPFYRASWRFVSALAAGMGGTAAVRHADRIRRYARLALMAGYQLTGEQMLAGQVFASSSGALVLGTGFFVLTGRVGAAAVCGLAGAFLGWVYPVMVVESRAQARQREIVRTLPFAIDLIVSAMRAGLDFAAAVRHYVATGGAGALAVEFGMLLRQMEFGKSRMEALEEMATHVQTPEFSAFVGAVAHGTEIGASIIDTLQVQGEDMRRARFNLAERKAARAPSIMIFPIALFILPAVFAIVLVPVFLRFQAAKGG